MYKSKIYSRFIDSGLSSSIQAQVGAANERREERNYPVFGKCGRILINRDQMADVVWEAVLF
jgi:hypothetical protein